MTEGTQCSDGALCVGRSMNTLTLQEGKGHKTPPSCPWSSHLKLCDVTLMISTSAGLIRLQLVNTDLTAEVINALVSLSHADTERMKMI